MKSRLFFVSFFCVFIFIAYVFYSSYGFIFFVKDQQLIKLTLKKSFFDQAQKELLVEVINTQGSITKGLSSRKDLVSESGQKIDGLLFIFPKKEIRQFWMKDMFFNIDICWLDNLAFLSCERQVQKPIFGKELKIYRSPIISNLVLETVPDYLSNEELKLKLFFKW